MPKLAFPGGALIGCAAGFVNVPRIKGSHNAMLSGMLAAEHVAAAIAAGRAHDELAAYEEAWRGSEIGKDLWTVRNAKPLWSQLRHRRSASRSAASTCGRTAVRLLALRHAEARQARLCRRLKPLDDFKPIVYPKPDGVLTFDKLSSVFLSNTNHEEDQPVHLKLRGPLAADRASTCRVYGEPARLYCPAGVYEVVYATTAAQNDPRFVINAQNCVHCKTCDIKDPDAEHRLGDAAGRRRAELSEHVSATPNSG